MFDHVTFRTADLERTTRLLTPAMTVLGLPPSGAVEFEDFGYDEGTPLTRHVHVAVAAPDTATVDAFWQAGVDAGLESDGAPGPRTQYGDDYYGAFLLDPGGNSIEACLHDNSPTPGLIDHVWLRVADVEASTAFYEAVAPWTRFSLVYVEDGYARFRGPSGSFSLVAGTPVSEHAHIAFAGETDEVVEGFHAAALAAGAPDNGGPGERPHYHPGYYGAFVLDPDGHNIEVVNHNR